MAIVNPMSGRTQSRQGRGGTMTDLERDIPYDARRRVGAFVQQARVERGITQQQLGAAMGVYNTAISAIELGRNSISPERYGELADLLGINRNTFGTLLLKYYNPWLYDLLYPGDHEVQVMLGQLPERVTDNRPEGSR